VTRCANATATSSSPASWSTSKRPAVHSGELGVRPASPIAQPRVLDTLADHTRKIAERPWRRRVDQRAVSR